MAGGHLAGAVVLASLGDRMPGTDLGAAFVEAAQKLAEVAQQG